MTPQDTLPQDESAALRWLLTEFARSLAAALVGMGCEDVSAEPTAEGELPAGEGSFWLAQTFNLSGSQVWLGSSASCWRELGTAAVRAIGLDSAEDTEVRDTYRETIAQSLSGLASRLTKQLNEEVTCGAGNIEEGPSAESVAGYVGISAGAAQPSTIAFAASLGMLQRITQTLLAQSPKNAVVTAKPAADEASTAGARFGLLLDVEMPVNVSFGNGRLSLEETLGLASGSTVSLGRRADDLLELNVNGRLVARGEIVVAQGQYAFRIRELSSLKERLNHLATAGRAA